jgi:hypothetical protein
MVYMQGKWNNLMAKLDADAAGSLDTDYVASLAVADIDLDEAVYGEAPHKASAREVMIRSLAHRRLGNEMIDMMEEFMAAYNAMLVKLDAQAGTLSETDFVELIGVDALDMDAEGEAAQHKASLRRSMRSAMRDRKAADEILDAYAAMQSSLNASLAALDAGSVNGAHAGFAVEVLDPDA